ncbi:MAG: PAS domain-containing protein [Nitrospirota bacterium]
MQKKLREAEERAEHKCAEESLKASENKYRTLVENLPQKIFLKDKNSVYVSCNENYARDLKIKSDEITGKTDYDFYPEELAEKYRADDKKIMESGKTEEIEEKYIKDEQEFIVYTVRTPVQDEKGNIIGILGIFWDITERKRMEEALKGSYEFIKTVLDNINDAISIIDVHDLRIVAVNRAFLKESGLEEKDIIGKKCHEITHHRHDRCTPPDDICPLTDAVKAGEPKVVEHVHYSKDGEKIYVEVSALPIKDNNGNVIQVVHVSRDITERKRTEDMLLQGQEEMKILNESIEITNMALDKERNELQIAIDGISLYIQQVVAKKDLSVRCSNPNLKRCYEIMQCAKKDCPCYGKEEMRCWQVAGTYCGGKVQGVFAEKFGNCVECPVFKFATSDPVYQIGEHFNNMMHILDLKNRELENAYTQLKAAQSQILQQEKMASIGQLAAGVAHEINNPIGFISSNLGTLDKYVIRLSEFIDAQSEFIEALNVKEALEKLKERRKKLKLDYITQDIKELINESLEGAERVKKIVQDLKSFSRVDEADYKHADINECLESTINIVWNELKYKVTLRKEYGDIPMTKCNPGQLNQVFMNILVNAAQAIEKQGEIIVKTWHDNGYINVSISDTGCGIPEDKLSKIFDPFFTTKEAGKGTGLGLSITYDIVKKHNGEITVQSEVGKGTTFNVLIPVVEGR